MKSSRHALLLLQVTTSCGGEEKLHQALSTSSKPRRETPRASDPSSCIVLLGKGFLQSNHPFLSRKKYSTGSEKAFPVFAGKWESALNTLSWQHPAGHQGWKFLLGQEMSLCTQILKGKIKISAASEYPHHKTFPNGF